MASALLRRSAFTALLAAAATIASPLAGIAFAADPALTAPTFTPADTKTATANRPAITVAYNTPLNTGASTLTVTDTSAGNAGVACPVTFSNNNATIGCTPTADLIDGHAYKVAVHAENNDQSSKRDDSATWTEDIPSVVAGTVKPTPGSTVGSGTTKVQATFDEAIDTNAANSYVVVKNANGNTVPGSTSFTKSGAPSPLAVTDTIVFSPAVPDGTYQVHIHVSASGNTAAFADVNFSYTVNGTPPPAAPTVTTAGYTPDGGATHWINTNNQGKVPFGGMAPDGFQVGIVVYQASTNTPPFCSHSDTSNLCANDRSTTVAVPDCGQDFCPWSGTIDLSATPQGSYQYWVYSFSAGGKLPAAPNTATDPTITKDTTRPGAPTFTAGSPVGTDAVDGSDPSTTTMNVTATDLDTSTYGYYVTATDAAGKTDSGSFTAGGSSSHPGATDLPVGDLEDGASSSAAAPLNVDVFAVDQAGNLSLDPNSVNAKSVTKETRTLTPDYANSYVTVNGQNIKFPAIANTRVHTPTSVTVRFNEIIRANDVNGNTTYFTSGMCFGDNTNLCLGGTTTITPDKHGLTFTLSDPSSVQDTGSPYRIEQVLAVAGTCPDSGTAGCEHYASTDVSPPNGIVLSFTIDNGPPSVTIDTSSLPNPITANTVKQTSLSGWTDPDTSSVSLLIQDSSGGNQIVPSSAIAITAPAIDPTSPTCTGTPKPHGCQATWSTKNPVDLSSLPDGTLTIVASATDSSGNAGPTDSSSLNPDGTARVASVALQARPSAPQNFSVAAGNGQAVLFWVAPATTGGHPLAGYNLTVTDTSVPGSTPAVVQLPASATSYTVSPLSNGHTYTLALRAANDIGSGPAATKSATPKGNTSVGVARVGTITYGAYIALRGSLTYLGVGLANEPITITSRYYYGGAGPTYHATTDQYGNWVVAGIRPWKNITYIPTFAGDSSYNSSSTSAPVWVRVALRIAKVSARSTSHASPVTLSGNVGPSQSGRRVYLYEVLSNGKLRSLGWVKVSSKSTWAYSHAFARGKHTVIARFFSQNGNIGNYSNKVRFSRS